MSLVNDMLKDLESRNVDRPDRLSESIAIPQMDDSRANPIFLFALLAMGLSVVVYLIAHTGVKTTSMIAQAASDNVVATASPASSSVTDSAGVANSLQADNALNNQKVSRLLASLPAPAVGNHEEAAIESVVSNPVQSAGVLDQQSGDANSVDTLLEDAENALSAHRLTTPVANNAWDYVQQALVIEPDNARAHALVDAITSEYVSLINRELETHNVSAAERLLARALAVNPADTRLQSLNDSIRRQQSLASTVVMQQTPVSIKSVSTQPSKQVSEQQVLAEARRLRQQGRVTDAEQVLLAFLQNVPDASNVSMQLFDWYSARDQWQAAEGVLSQSHNLPPSLKAFMSAQILVHENNINAAIAILQKSAPAVSDSVAYHAYLAGLYQKQGQYAAAANHYRQLLAVDSTQATFWLGLGVALDALQDRQALQAYLQIGSSPDLSNDVRRFVLQRIQVLSS